MTADQRPHRIRRLVALRLAIAVTTTGSLIVAFTVSMVWFDQVEGLSRLEPAVESLGLLAGITGIVATHLAATRERRQQSLNAVHEELRINHALLTQPPFSVGSAAAPRREIYPRLYTSAVEAALLSTALSPRRDAGLIRHLHEWRHTIDIFNQRLQIAEVISFLDETDEAARQVHAGLHQPQGPLSEVRRHLEDLTDVVAQAAGLPTSR